MKKLTAFIVIVVIALTVVLSAFKIPHPQKKATISGWFTIVNTSAPGSASSYNYYGSTAPCSGSDVLCAIYGTQQSGNANLPLQSDVDQAKMDSENFTQPVNGEVDFKAQ